MTKMYSIENQFTDTEYSTKTVTKKNTFYMLRSFTSTIILTQTERKIDEVNYS